MRSRRSRLSTRTLSAEWSAKSLSREFRERALNPDAPVTRGTAQNGDVYFQGVESRNQFYDAVPDIVARYMGEISELTGREYRPFTYYGDPDAENIIVAMGSVTETIKETIDYLASQGRKCGLVTVHLYRPFSEKYFLKVLPKNVKRIAVLDRTKENGALGEPLYMDVKALFQGKANSPLIVGGRYGLSSKDTTPAQIIAVYDNLELKEPKNGLHHRHRGRRDLQVPPDQERDLHREARHHRVQVLRTRIRRYRRCQQEHHQDHRKPYRRSTARHTSTTIPRSPAATPARTSVSATCRSRLPTLSALLTS